MWCPEQPNSKCQRKYICLSQGFYSFCYLGVDMALKFLLTRHMGMAQSRAPLCSIPQPANFLSRKGITTCSHRSHIFPGKGKDGFDPCYIMLFKLLPTFYSCRMWNPQNFSPEVSFPPKTCATFLKFLCSKSIHSTQKVASTLYSLCKYALWELKVT